MSNEEQRTMEDLIAWQTRLESDIRRSRMMDDTGITRNSPLMKNLEKCKQGIANVVKEGK